MAEEKPLSMSERSTNVVFTGNYTPPETFNIHIERLGDEYTAFYHGIINDLIANPSLSMEKVIEQAEKYGHSEEREYAFLITHSMLHLCGYDHMVPEEAEIMEEKQETVLQSLNILR